MNPKWRDYIIGFALFLLAAALICLGRAVHAQMNYDRCGVVSWTRNATSDCWSHEMVPAKAGVASGHLSPSQLSAIKEAGAIAAPLPVIRCAAQTRVGGIQLRHPARYASRTHCGADFALTLQAVIGQESSYCTKLVNRRDPSYGCGGLILKTAREVAGRKVTPRELIRDRALNLRLTARYLHALITRYGWARGVCSFNHGPASAKCATVASAERDAYVPAIRQRIAEVLRSVSHD